MTEILSLLLERESATTDSRMPWPSISSSELEVPDTVEGVVRKRLDPLGKELVELLRIAALIGEDFELGILSKASGIQDQGHLFGLIQKAVKSGIIRKKST